MEGHAKEITEEDLSHATSIYAQKATKDEKEKQNLCKMEDFLDGSPLRMYTFTPTTIYINTADKWHGKWIDTRIEVSLID